MIKRTVFIFVLCTISFMTVASEVWKIQNSEGKCVQVKGYTLDQYKQRLSSFYNDCEYKKHENFEAAKCNGKYFFFSSAKDVCETMINLFED